MYTLYMALHITNAEAERNVRRLAAITGDGIAETINKAAVEQLRIVRESKDDPRMMDEIFALLREFDALPRLDDRSPDEIIGYDENGLPS